MSEAAISKTSRKSSTPQLPVDYEVEDTGDGRLRVQVQAPSLTRVIAHPLFPYREEPTHPFLRPLRRLFVEGSPDLGRVWYILVSGGPRTFPGVLLAIVLTQGHEKAPAYVRGLAPHKLSVRSEEHTSELQSRFDLVCRLLLEKKKTKKINHGIDNKDQPRLLI